MSIPGIGYHLTSLLSSYIGDVERFDSDDKLASFFGVEPAMKVSSGVKRRGRMAHVSTMRKLVRMMYHMLRNREQWKYENASLTDSKPSALNASRE